MKNTPQRCRLVLITPNMDDSEMLSTIVGDALRGGDVASVIIPQYDLNDQQYQTICERVVPAVQAVGAAALLAGDTRVMGRCKADGLHVMGGFDDMIDAVERFSPEKIVGGGNAKDRHNALGFGDIQPDYLFFGKIDGDIRPEAHHKNLKLGAWWAEFVEIPCIVMGGTHIDSAFEVAQTGCDFVALRSAIFDDPAKSALKIAEINAILDEKAPLFDD